MPAFLKVLSDPTTSLNVSGQIIWAFGNVAGDSVEDRDQLLAQGAVDALVKASEVDGFFTKDREMLRTTAWATANLCRGKPAPKMAQVQGLIPVLKTMINGSDHVAIADACYGLSYLCAGSDENISNVLNHGVAQRLVDLFDVTVKKENGDHTADDRAKEMGLEELSEKGLDHVLVPVLRTIGNIISAEDPAIVDVVLNIGAIEPLKTLAFKMINKKTSIRKEACWTLSNITAGTTEQVQMAIDSGIFGHDMNQLLEDTDDNHFVLQKETMYIIENLSASSTVEQMKEVYASGVVPSICQLLDPVKHPLIEKRNAHEVVGIALKSIAAFMRMSKATSPKMTEVQDIIEQRGKAAIYRIAHESDSDSNSVYAQNILDTYFDH